MKILFALAIVLMNATAQAATIACTSDNPAFISGGAARTATFLCSPGAGAGAGSFDDNLAGDGWGITSFRPEFDYTSDPRLRGVGDVNLFELRWEGPTFSQVYYLSASDGRGSPSTPNILSPIAILSPTPVAGQPDTLAPFTVTVTPTQVFQDFGRTWSASVSYEVSAVQLSPVPEPQAYLMMLLGLGVVVGVARRRRNARA